MKEKFTNVVDGLFIFLLVICSFACLVSSFGIAINLPIVALCVAMFTLVFALLAVLEKSTEKYSASLAVIFVVFLLIVFMSVKILLSQLDYAVNSVLEIYSKYLPVAKSVDISADSASSATALFVAIALPLSGLLTTFIMRCRVILPAVIISVVPIIPCFMLVNTLPDILPLFTMLVILFTMYITSAIHRTNTAHSGAISCITAVLMAVVIAVVYTFNPVEGYKRSNWQDDLLNITKQIGFKSYDKNSDDVLSEEYTQKEVDLSTAGPQEKRNQRHMKITTPYAGKIYLKGIAYANYEDNTWSTLTKEQIETYPDNFNSTIMTKSDGIDEIDITILTLKNEDVLYTPYYLSSASETGTVLYDISILNNSEENDYSFSYRPFDIENFSAVGRLQSSSGFGSYSFGYVQNENYIEYKNFVYQNYLSVPEDIKAEMISYAEAEGFAYLSREEITDSVKEYVKNSASYSLETERVPDGKDISTWLLSESDTGYCVHFATSTAIMLRSLGIPARYVTGYCVQPYTETTVITSDNAHAWVEYFDNDIGWVPLDATPRDFSLTNDTIQSDTNSATQPATQADTQASIQPATEPASEPTGTSEISPTQATDNPHYATIIPSDIQAKKTLSKSTIAVLVTISLIILCVLTLLIRRKIVLYLRKKKFTSGKRVTRVIYIYRYLLKLSEFSHIPFSDDIHNIAEKARFGNSRITPEELDALLTLAEKRQTQLITNATKLKKIYFKYILALA